MDTFIQIGMVTLYPMILTMIFAVLEKKEPVTKEVPYMTRQIIYGVCFGILAIIGTERGIPVNGAQINARDAAVITAGLIFGAPAGIIAGLMGGIERYIAVAWGVGTYTQIACTVSTIAAGFYAAILRKFMFDNRKPSWSLAFAIGLVIEIFHMTMVFVTHLEDTTHAAQIVKICSLYMVPANAIGTMLPTLVDHLITDEKNKKVELKTISQSIQSWLLAAVSILFLLTSLFIYGLQTSIAERQARDYLSLAIQDVVMDVEEVSNKNLIQNCLKVKPLIGTKPLEKIAEELGIAEINLVNSKGVVYETTNPKYVDFDFNDGDRAAEFLCLLNGDLEYVQDYGQMADNESIYRKYVGVTYKGGFIQVAYDNYHFQSEISSQVKTAAVNRHVGNTGYIIIADDNRWIVSSPDEVEINRLDDFKFNKNLESGSFFKTKIAGEDSLCHYINVEGYYVISVMPMDEVYDLRDTALYANTFMEILIFALFFAMVYLLVKRLIVDKIKDVNKSLAKITQGDLDEEVNVRTNLEFDSLSNDINSTVTTLKGYIAQVSEKIKAELEYAKNIQNSALPHVFPKDERFEMFALMRPAKEVGGDFYDFARIGHDTFNFLVADVSGKGIPGAMFMMRAKSVLSSFTEMHLDVNDIFTQGNERLCEGNDAGMFVTSWEAAIDLTSGHIEYANAGHNPPVIRRKDGTCEFIKGKAGFVLAGMEGIQYKAQQVDLEPGDILFLYTDGVVEATNADKVLYGDDRLLNTMKNAEFNTMEELCEYIINDVDKFVGEAEQFDDITMLAFKYLGNVENNEHN